MMWTFLTLTTLWLTVADAANLTATMTSMAHYGGPGFSGKFCFHLTQATIGWELFVEFSSPVSDMEEVDTTVLEKRGSGECSRHWTLVNKVYQGLHNAGYNLCVRVSAQACGGAEPTGTATFVDLTHVHQEAPPAPHMSGAAHTKYNYAEVIQKSILFYEAQRSGKLPANNRISWRGDSALQDHGDNGEDLTGGWYDAGDNVKFNFPMAFSTTLLCWGLLEFPEAYRKSGQLDHMYDTIRWPLEYFVKCHTGANELYVQVGNGNSDHTAWTSPEQMDQNRPAYKITNSKPGSDVAGETAAAMACGYLAFKTKDSRFANTLLTHSKQIYNFAKSHHGFYSSSVPDASNFYKSSNYTDELTWAAIWLHKATNQASYLHDAESTYIPGAGWGFSWDEKLDGNKVLLYDATQNDQYLNDVEATLTYWSPQGSIAYTPKCLAWRLQWGALRYSANTAFIALVTAKREQDQAKADKYRQWAMCQIHYALGDAGRSYVVGFGTNPPVKPHHRGASCPWVPSPCAWEAQQNPDPNPHTLFGAMVGGPGKSDDYTDSRIDYTHNEVACDYNAGMQGAVAGLLQLAVDHDLPSANQCGHC